MADMWGLWAPLLLSAGLLSFSLSGARHGPASDTGTFSRGFRTSPNFFVTSVCVSPSVYGLWFHNTASIKLQLRSGMKTTERIGGRLSEYPCKNYNSVCALTLYGCAHAQKEACFSLCKCYYLLRGSRNKTTIVGNAYYKR
jgi:hypothetical protein